MRYFVIVLFSFLTAIPAAGQDDLLKMLDADKTKETEIVPATFKSTRILNGHSVMRMPTGQLDFRISHRFGHLNSGIYEFFGLDQSSTHFSLEYGITDWFMAGIGRGSFEKTYDGFVKFTLLRQSTGNRAIPVSVSLLSSMASTSVKWPDPTRTNYFSSRLSFVHQLLIARKFNQAFSFQVTPSFIHRNLVATLLDPNDLFSVGAGGRMKLTKRISFNGEYFYNINSSKYGINEMTNPFSLGFDIETGGHVFQLIFTNSLAMIEKGFIGETTGSWRNGDIHIGFNISRVFKLK
jgi:hypothetical protein